MNDIPSHILQHEGSVVTVSGNGRSVHRGALAGGGELLAGGDSQKAVAALGPDLVIAGVEKGADAFDVVRVSGSERRSLFATPQPRCVACIAVSGDAVVVLAGKRTSDRKQLIVGGSSGTPSSPRSIDLNVAGDGSPIERLFLRGTVVVFVSEQQILAIDVVSSKKLVDRAQIDPVRDGPFIGGALIGDDLLYATRTEFQSLRVLGDGSISVVGRLPPSLGAKAEVRSLGVDAGGIFAIIMTEPGKGGLFHQPL